MQGGGGGEALDLHRRMAAQRVAFKQQIADVRGSTEAAASAFSAALLSARSLANHTLSQREKFNQLKDQLRRVEADFSEAMSIQVCKRTTYELTGESISSATATNEQLRSLVMDQRARRDEYAIVISNQLEAIEELEAKSDATGKKNIDEAILWYRKFLGFKVVGGEVLQCVPFMKDSEELVKDLNCSNDLFKFVRTMRERFQAATVIGLLPASSFCTDTSSITVSSSPALSTDTGSESTTTTNRSHSQNRAKNQDNPSKRGKQPSKLLSSTCRSRRVAAADSTNRY
uniref:Kinetochore protein SPC25 n=1 Tax=Leersia perrieri TaxID=77586 RepID=A0A0D9VAW2_9ORYZ